MKIASRFLSSLIIIVLLAVAGCGGQNTSSDGGAGSQGSADSTTGSSNEQSFEGHTLRVAVYGGNFKEAFVKAIEERFESLTGANLEYVEGNPMDNLSKLIASQGAAPPYDVAIFDDGPQAIAIEQGLFDKLDPEKIPNLQNLFPSMLNKEGYGPSFYIWQTGIAYNKQIFEEQGIPAPKGWEVLWDPKVAGHVAIPDITVAMGPYTLVGVAMTQGGDDQNIQPGLDKLASIDPEIYPSSSVLETLFSNGDVWVASWIDGRAGSMQDKGQPIEFVKPEFDSFIGMAGTDTIDIVKGTKEKELAYILINEFLSKESQKTFALLSNYSTSHQEAAAEIKAEGKGKHFWVFSPEEAEKAYKLDWQHTNNVLPQWTDQWNKTFKR